MADPVTADELAEAMFRMISDAQGVAEAEAQRRQQGDDRAVRARSVQQGRVQGGHPHAGRLGPVHLHVFRRQLHRAAEAGDQPRSACRARPARLMQEDSCRRLSSTDAPTRSTRTASSKTR
ncbi:MAG: hypothetical protein M0C28_37260 [Candidatus Moduliflexus flocculans]|nr:hypothetical protein [Candidatus Moduliflexus flocculans]